MNTDAYLELRRRLDALSAAERISGAEMFMGRPDRWYDTPRWRCSNAHVSRTYLKSEVAGDLCLACLEPVAMTFPEDTEGPLPPSGATR